MTEKRFQIDDDGDITEFENQQWIDCWEYANGKHWNNLCNKLNELYEENEQLKSTLYYLLNVIQNKCPKDYPKCKEIVRNCFENDFNNTENDGDVE